MNDDLVKFYEKELEAKLLKAQTEEEKEQLKEYYSLLIYEAFET